MRIVALQREILEAEGIEVFNGGIDLHHRPGARLARELEFRLLQMIRVKMQIAEGVDKFAWLQITHLRDHQGEQRVAGDVERHAEKKIRAALVELATKPSLIDEELEQTMAGRQRHLFDVRHVPRADDVAA